MSPYWDSTKAVAPGLEMGKRKGPGKTSGADARQRPAQARPSAAAPWRESTAEALRGLRWESGKVLEKARNHAGFILYQGW